MDSVTKAVSTSLGDFQEQIRNRLLCRKTMWLLRVENDWMAYNQITRLHMSALNMDVPEKSLGISGFESFNMLFTKILKDSPTILSPHYF